jgi:hypothetical protein
LVARNLQPRLQIRQRLLGLALLAVSAAGIYFVWRFALVGRIYNGLVSAALPVLAVCGFGLMLFPFGRDRIPLDPGLAAALGEPEVPRSWQFILLVALLAGLANWYAIQLLI